MRRGLPPPPVRLLRACPLQFAALVRRRSLAHNQSASPRELYTLRDIPLQVTALPSLPRLLRLDLSSNRLASIDALAAHSALKWLSVARNSVTALPPLNIPELQVSAAGQSTVMGAGLKRPR